MMPPISSTFIGRRTDSRGSANPRLAIPRVEWNSSVDLRSLSSPHWASRQRGQANPWAPSSPHSGDGSGVASFSRGPATEVGNGSHPGSNRRGAQLRMGPARELGDSGAGTVLSSFRGSDSFALGHPLLRESYINNRRNVQAGTAGNLESRRSRLLWGLARAGAS